MFFCCLIRLVCVCPQLKAVYEKMELQQRAMVSPEGSVASGRSSSDHSEPELSNLQPYLGSEIEVTPSALKSSTYVSATVHMSTSVQKKNMNHVFSTICNRSFVLFYS